MGGVRVALGCGVWIGQCRLEYGEHGGIGVRTGRSARHTSHIGDGSWLWSVGWTMSTGNWRTLGNGDGTGLLASHTRSLLT